jgi:aryl-alcohol dehydrogenase-like predicted oxidoreductase
MRYRALGHSGLMVSVVGLGCNNFGARVGLERAREVVDAAFDAGVTLFDTADVYGRPHGTSEEILGETLRGRRHEALIATKFGNPMGGANGRDWDARGSRRYVRIAVEESLRRLGTDWIDLYQLHRPDRNTPIEETLSALDDLVREGKVRYLGCSNFAAWQVADADWTARHHGQSRFVSVQNEYNLLHREVEPEVLPACERFGLGLLPFFPLASGLLTGKYRRDEQPPAGWRLGAANWAAYLRDAPWDLIERLTAFAAEAGHSLLDLAFAGLTAHAPVASVIAGATSAEQVRANVAAGGWELTADQRTALAALFAAG